ncbi:MAG: acyltransferase family protein [Hyphomicrobiales bacterium]
MRHIEQIQVLRALAALAIVIHHGIYEAVAFAAAGGAAFVPPRLLPWPAGVDLFFVISGFVMVYASRNLFGTRDGPKHFLWRRIARIVPLYWSTTALVLLADLLIPGAVRGAEPSLAMALASFAFIPFMRPDGVAQPLYSLGWTLNYEMFFYVVFALFLPFSRPFAVAGVAAVLVALCGFGLLAQPAGTVLAFWSAPIILLFAAGMGIAMLRMAGASLPSWLRLSLAAAALMLLALDPFDRMRNPLDIVQTLDFTRVAAWGIPAALLVAAAALGRQEGRAEQKSSAFWSGLVALGEASYALYLVHPFVFRPVREALLRLGLAPVIGPWPYLALVVICASFASLIVHWLAERPITTYLQTRFA